MKDAYFLFGAAVCALLLAATPLLLESLQDNSDSAPMEAPQNQYVDQPQDASTKRVRGEAVRTYVLYDAPTYTNLEYGFSITMPKSWVAYAVSVYKGSDDVIEVRFALPMQGDKLPESLADDEALANVFDVAVFEILPIAFYESHKKDCEGGGEGPCYSPIEITRNATHVFATGLPKPHVQWFTCDDFEESEPYICSVYKEVGWDYIEKSLVVLE